jgi:ubiquinone/menaquinone biosynthesis C-methylase UbiE
MPFKSLKQFVSGFLSTKETDPRRAYNLWARGYDSQPGNLMLDLDEKLFSELIDPLDIKGAVVADIGCGTGRHWTKLLAKQPARIAGFDVSEGMLRKLNAKFPTAETHLLAPDNFVEMPNSSCNLVFSTLTIAHIQDTYSALSEWERVLANNGDLVITDYHPAVLQKGGQRTFRHNGRLVAVKNYVHTIESIRDLARQLQLKEIRFNEKIIDESLRSWYEQQNALAVYEKYRGSPVIYGIHFKKE